MSKVAYLAPGIDKTEFQCSLIVVKSKVGARVSYSHLILSPPTVSLDLFFSDLCGLYSWIGPRRPVGRAPAFGLSMSDFNSETRFGILVKNYTQDF